MKVFIATKKTQGRRKNDFDWCDDREAVTFGMSCDSDHGDPDGHCGCCRSMVGIHSRKATTTMEVYHDVDMTRGALEALFIDAMSASWGKVLSVKDIREQCEEDVRVLCDTIESFAVGDVIEKRGDTFARRAV